MNIFKINNITCTYQEFHRIMRSFVELVQLQLNRKTVAAGFQTAQRVSTDKTTRKCVRFFFHDNNLSFLPARCTIGSSIFEKNRIVLNFDFPTDGSPARHFVLKKCTNQTQIVTQLVSQLVNFIYKICYELLSETLCHRS